MFSQVVLSALSLVLDATILEEDQHRMPAAAKSSVCEFYTIVLLIIPLLQRCSLGKTFHIHAFHFAAASMQAALNKRIAQLERQLEQKQRQLVKARKEKYSALQEMENLKSGLKSHLNPDQFRYLERKTMRGSSWSQETLIKALKIRLSSGSRGYDLVREVGQPLPGERTLQRHLEGYKFQPGMLVDVMDSLAVKVYILLFYLLSK